MFSKRRMSSVLVGSLATVALVAACAGGADSVAPLQALQVAETKELPLLATSSAW
jgi:hypothetical protein